MEKSTFIKINTIHNDPVHTVTEFWMRTDLIASFGYPNNEFTKIGAGSIIYDVFSHLFYVRETPDELMELLKTPLRLGISAS